MANSVKLWQKLLKQYHLFWRSVFVHIVVLTFSYFYDTWRGNIAVPARHDRVDAPVDGEVRVEGDAGAVVGRDGALVGEAVAEDGEDARARAEAVRGEEAAVVHFGGHVAAGDMVKTSLCYKPRCI